MSTLIVPAAKLVPDELQKIGKLPAIIYPINQKIVFDYIYDLYKSVCSTINIICYEKSEKVHRRLSSYLLEQVRIIDLPQLNDLGHTIYYGIKDIEDDIIINFSDTILLDSIKDNLTDCFYYAQEDASEKWTYFDIKDGVITKIYDKTDKYNSEINKLFVGVFKIKDTSYLKKCLLNAFEEKNSEISTFYKAIMEYSKKNPLKPLNTQNWFDIGHIEKYIDTQLEVKAREFNHITIDKNRGILKKTSDNKDKFIGEILWYLKLPSDIEYVRPRIFSYSTEYQNPYVCMEYYAYHTIHELFLYGDLTKKQWIDIFNIIKFVCCDFKKYQLKDNKIKLSLEDMYLTKTIQRLEQMRKDECFKEFFTKSIFINGKKYKPLNSIFEQLKTQIPKMLYNIDTFHIIHGDLCFANIMVDSNFSFVKLIDPRGKFGEYDIYGDFRYELAKLFHSIDGKYDYIIKDLFKVDYDTSSAVINYSINERIRDYDLYTVLLDVFNDEIKDSLKEIELIEALLFLSMVPLHGESKEHQMAMLATGVEILNRVINIEE